MKTYVSLFLLFAAATSFGQQNVPFDKTFNIPVAPTGLAGAASADSDVATARSRVRATAADLGTGRLRMLVGKPGLDGHSNGAEQIAVRATDAGMDVVYDGIRLTPAEIVERARDGVHCVGLSILSGSHLAMASEVADGLRQAGLGYIPVVVGGIIPEADAAILREKGIAAVYTPKDFAINRLIGDIVQLVDARTD